MFKPSVYQTIHDKMRYMKTKSPLMKDKLRLEKNRLLRINDNQSTIL